jgi:hypothetical protein
VLAANAGAVDLEFPLKAIRDVAVKQNRSDTLYYHQLLSLPWFATKVLTPSRTYVFHENKPQVDHIFPLGLPGSDDPYKCAVDVLWNFQPMPAGVNNYKQNRNPKEFFNSVDGAKYWTDYDFIPDPHSPVWSDFRHFIRYRHLEMRRMLLKRYGLRLKRIREQ